MYCKEKISYWLRWKIEENGGTFSHLWNTLSSRSYASRFSSRAVLNLVSRQYSHEMWLHELHSRRQLHHLRHIGIRNTDSRSDSLTHGVAIRYRQKKMMRTLRFHALMFFSRRMIQLVSEARLSNPEKSMKNTCRQIFDFSHCASGSTPVKSYEMNSIDVKESLKKTFSWLDVWRNSLSGPGVRIYSWVRYDPIYQRTEKYISKWKKEKMIGTHSIPFWRNISALHKHISWEIYENNFSHFRCEGIFREE